MGSKEPTRAYALRAGERIEAVNRLGGTGTSQGSSEEPGGKRPFRIVGGVLGPHRVGEAKVLLRTAGAPIKRSSAIAECGLLPEGEYRTSERMIVMLVE
ncbi:hypothetical protein SUGI_1225650 [Cryptomeria japonica]|uniref:Uncharacterized protein n=1 Tax=Cryptomeria japonica TaxID=3369 RepID=A0AAD3NJI7_CRYJA|nr:hypothetical protein SUGI_1225650 [Cryptomeria japonica]